MDSESSSVLPTISSSSYSSSSNGNIFSSSSLSTVPVTTETSDSMAFRCDFHVQCSVKRNNVYENPVRKICIVGIVHGAGPFLALCHPDSSSMVNTIIGCSNWESCVMYESEHSVEIILCNPVLFDGTKDIEAIKLTCCLSSSSSVSHPSSTDVGVQGGDSVTNVDEITVGSSNNTDNFNDFFNAWLRVGAISSTEVTSLPLKSSSNPPSSPSSSQLLFTSKDGSPNGQSSVSHLSNNKHDLKRALKLQVLHDPDFIAVVDSLCELVLASGTSKTERKGESRSQYRRSLLTKMYESLASIPNPHKSTTIHNKSNDGSSNEIIVSSKVDSTAPTAQDLSIALKLEKFSNSAASGSSSSNNHNNVSCDSHSVHTQSTKHTTNTNKASRIKNANKIINNMNSMNNNNNNNGAPPVYMSSSSNNNSMNYNTPPPNYNNNDFHTNNIPRVNKAEIITPLNNNDNQHHYHRMNQQHPNNTHYHHPNHGSSTTGNGNYFTAPSSYSPYEPSSTTPVPASAPMGYYVTDSTTGQVYYQPVNTSSLVSSPSSMIMDSNKVQLMNGGDYSSINNATNYKNNNNTALASPTSYVYDSNSGTYYPVNYSSVPSSPPYVHNNNGSFSSSMTTTTPGSNPSNIMYRMVPSFNATYMYAGPNTGASSVDTNSNA